MAHQPGPYGRLARWVLDHRRPTALIIGVVSLLGVVFASQLQVDANLLSLLPEDDPHAQAFFELYQEEGGLSLLTIALAIDDPERTGELAEVTERLSVELGSLERVQYAIHTVDPAIAYHVGLLQLEPEDVSELTVRMKGALALGPALNPIVTQRLMDMGPLAERIARAFDMPFLDPDPARTRILVRPTGPGHDREFCQDLMVDVDAVLASADLDAHGVRVVWLGGPYRHNVEDVRAVQTDLVLTSLAASLLVLVAMTISFRSWRATLLVFVPLILANAVNLGLVWLSIGHINTFTSFGTAVLVGLGIAIAVHLVGRYKEERSQGKSLEDAIERAWDHTGPPCTTAALTSSAGFMALAVADCRGFSQLGTLLAMGMLVCLVMMLVALPLLIPVFDPRPRPLLGARPDLRPTSRSTYRLAPLVLMVVVVATCVAVARIPDMSWEFDMSTLRSAGLAYDELSAEEQELVRDSYVPVVVSYDSHEELAEDQERLERLAADGILPHVAQVISVENVLPADQAQRVAALTELARLMEHRNLRYLPRPIVEWLLPLRDWEPHILRREDVPIALLDLLGAEEEGRHQALVFPKGNLWDLRESRAFKDEMMQAVPNRRVAGPFMAQGALLDLVMRDLPIVAGLALLMVTLLTAIDLRQARGVVAAIGILLAGMVWAGVMVDALGVKLSIVNIVGVPILLGIGVDVVIHLLHRLREEGPGGVRRVLSTTGVAVTVSVVTTVLSFGSLTLASSRGIRSLGWLVVIGLTTIYLVSMALVPLVWAAAWRFQGKAPADQQGEE